MPRVLIALSLLISGLSEVHAEDAWIQSNTNLVRTGDAIYLDLMLGNSGPDRRGYRLAGKSSLQGATLSVTGPDGKPFPLIDRLIDNGDSPNEGYWSTKYVATKSGLYRVAHTRESVQKATRTVNCGKLYFVANPKLDYIVPDQTGYEAPLGHPLELVPIVNPVLPMGPGSPISVKLMYRGKPLADTVVSFIPRGETLKAGFDETYERRTDAKGKATFTPKTGNWYLIVAHRLEDKESGDGYDRTNYSATLNVFVPEFCACCD